jgi:hypothetical protein
MPCTPHRGEDIVKILGQTLFGPISFPSLTESEEQIDGPAICIRPAFTSQEHQQIL